jgi:multidrug resistance efflux pump
MKVADWNAAQATVGCAKAQMDEAKLNLSYADVTSPMDGVVTHCTVEVGQYVQAGQAMLQIIPLNDVWVVANFKATQLAHVRPGQRARIYIDTFGMDVEGWVDSIAGSTGARQALLPPENATGNYVKVVERIPVKLRVRCANPLRHSNAPCLKPVALPVVAWLQFNPTCRSEPRFCWIKPWLLSRARSCAGSSPTLRPPSLFCLSLSPQSHFSSFAAGRAI